MRLPSAVSVFRELVSVPTAPFFERAVAGRALAWIRRELGPRVRVSRHRGGLVVRYRGAGDGPAIALAAHIDHPGFHLSRVNAGGALAELQGGLLRDLLPGRAVEAYEARPRDNEPAARGVLGEPSGAVYPVRWTAAPRAGSRPAFAVLALPAFAVEGRWLASRSIDDLLGAAVSLEALRRLARARAKTNATVLLHRAEEVGFIGALALAADGAASPRDSVVSVETSRRLADAVPGRGPVVRLGDRATLFDPNLTALLDEAALALRRRAVATQRARLTGGTCEATAYLAFGYEASGVAMPLVNYHNGADGVIGPERVRLEDVEGATRLLVEAARRFPKATLRGRLRERLDARLRAARRALSENW